MGRTEFLTCNQITSEPWLVEQKQRPQLERNGALRSARASAPQKCLTLPTLLETRFFANSGQAGNSARGTTFLKPHCFRAQSASEQVLRVLVWIAFPSASVSPARL